MLGWLVVVLAMLVGLFLMLGSGPEALDAVAGEDRLGIYLTATVLGAYALFLMSRQGSRLGTALKHLAIWAGLFLALVAGYAYKDDLSGVVARVAGELAPPGSAVSVDTTEAGERAVRIRRRGDGHFSARAEVNGAKLTMMVDTGASTVVLRPADAEKAGIDTRSIQFTVPVQTANGTAYAAPVRLRSISIGGIAVRDVEALVSKPGVLKESLLGMSFLRRLRSYEFTGEFLTLRS